MYVRNKDYVLRHSRRIGDRRFLVRLGDGPRICEPDPIEVLESL